MAGAGAVVCGIASFAAAAMSAGFTVLPLAAAGAMCLRHARGVSRGVFRSQCYVLAATIALPALSLPLVPAAAASLLALLFSRTNVAAPDTFAAGAIHWRTGTVMTLLTRLPERTTTGVDVFAATPAARRQLI